MYNDIFMSLKGIVSSKFTLLIQDLNLVVEPQAIVSLVTKFY